MTKITVILMFLLMPLFIRGQTDPTVIEQASPKVTQGLVLPENAVLVRAVIYNGDTIPYARLAPIVCYVPRVYKNERAKAAWERTRYNVKKVYPYAILAAAKLKEYDRILATIPNESDKKKYTKIAEQQLKAQFGEELKNLSMTQGRVLIKLIDRETGSTAYEVVKEMRGSFSAFMWQGLAILFSSNLKDDYDPEGEDKSIEDAIKLIENGDF